MTDEAIEVAEEQGATYDFGGDGFKLSRRPFTITKAAEEVQESDEAGVPVKVRAVIELTAKDDDGFAATVTLREWIKHPSVTAQRIGRGNLKRLFQAFTGGVSGTIASLVGKVASGEGYEDKEGFRRAGRFRQQKQTEVTETLDGSGDI